MDCEMCSKPLYDLVCDNEYCGQIYDKCSKCKGIFTPSDLYEYRGALACVECIDEVTELRDFQRQEIIDEEAAKTECFKGLDLGDNPLGKANREILKPQIEIASKESGRLKAYEGR